MEIILNLIKKSWHLLYQMIKRHPDVLEFLISKGIFQSYVETITAVSPNAIVLNSLHFFISVFTMVAREKQKMLNAAGGELKSTMRTSKKLQQMKSNLNLLNKYFIEKRIFIKFHMIFKRVCSTTGDSSNFPGLLWIKLAELYDTIRSVEACSKMRKDIINHSEYSKGYNYMLKVLGDRDRNTELNLGVPKTGESMSNPNIRASADVVSNSREQSSSKIAFFTPNARERKKKKDVKRNKENKEENNVKEDKEKKIGKVIALAKDKKKRCC